MSNNKSYLVKVEHDTNSFDLMDMVNKTLKDAGYDLKFTIEADKNDPNNTYINYSLLNKARDD